MPKVVVTRAQDMNFETPDGKQIDGVSLNMILDDGKAEKAFISRDRLNEVGFDKEMVTDLFSPNGDIVYVNADFQPNNGKLKLAKLTLE